MVSHSSNAADRVVEAFRARRGKPVVGIRAQFTHLPPLDLMATLGVEFIYLDRQHGPCTIEDIWTIGTALARHDVLILVRVSHQSRSEIGAVLDAGAHGIIIPDVSTPQQAAEMLDAMRYPPRGSRSWGAYPYDGTGYGGPAPRQADALCLPMIESAEGVKNAAAIASMPGVDGIYVGRYDLALSLGVDASAVSPGGARHDAIKTIRAACDAASIPMATTGKPAALIDEGFRMITLGSELDLLRRGLEAAREGLPR